MAGYGGVEKTELWPKPDSQCTLADFPPFIPGAVGFWTAQGPTVCGGIRVGNVGLSTLAFLKDMMGKLDVNLNRVSLRSSVTPSKF